MSLTYPVLNDIYAVKINELNSFIDLVDEKLVGNQTELNSKLDNVTSQVNNQNIKIDLIHNLLTNTKLLQIKILIIKIMKFLNPVK